MVDLMIWCGVAIILAILKTGRGLKSDAPLGPAVVMIHLAIRRLCFILGHAVRVAAGRGGGGGDKNQEPMLR